MWLHCSRQLTGQMEVDGDSLIVIFFCIPEKSNLPADLSTSEDLQGQRLDYSNLLSVSKLDLQEWWDDWDFREASLLKSGTNVNYPHESTLQVSAGVAFAKDDERHERALSNCHQHSGSSQCRHAAGGAMGPKPESCAAWCCERKQTGRVCLFFWAVTLSKSHESWVMIHHL